MFYVPLFLAFVSFHPTLLRLFFFIYHIFFLFPSFSSFRCPSQVHVSSHLILVCDSHSFLPSRLVPVLHFIFVSFFQPLLLYVLSSLLLFFYSLPIPSFSSFLSRIHSSIFIFLFLLFLCLLCHSFSSSFIFTSFFLPFFIPFSLHLFPPKRFLYDFFSELFFSRSV